MGEMLSTQKSQARSLGWQAVAGWTVAALLLWKAGLIIGLGGAVLSAYLTRRWFQYRAKWGLRF